MRGQELSEAEDAVFQTIVRVYISQAYNRWVARHAITDQTGAGGQYLIDAIAANLHGYSGFRAANGAIRSWAAEGRRFEDDYLAECRNALDTRLAELAKIEPEPDWDLKHCGM